MQVGAQVAIIATGAVTAYLMAKLTPKADAKIATDTPEPTEEIPAEEAIECEPYCAWNLRLAKDDDFDIIQHITEQSLSHELENSTPVAKKKALEIMKFGLPCYSNLRFFDSYCSSINYYTSIPNWCGELISNDDLQINECVDRKNCPGFCEDESVPNPFRSSLTDFKRSGLSRGHLVPAGDHNSCQLNKDLTFKLSNVVPQSMSMNGCDWLRIERFVKKLVLTNDEIDKCWIFSGPVFKPKFKDYDDHSYCKPVMVKKKYEEGEEDKEEMEEILKVYNERKGKTARDGRLKGKIEYNTIGATHVHVPTHLYKVILAERNDDVVKHDNINKYQLAAFMVANEAIHDKVGIREYLIDIEELEHFVGLQFFPKLRCGTDADHGNVAKYAELCLNYDCEYDDDERSAGWRGLGILETAKSLQELENVWKAVDEKGFEQKWVRGMYKRAYYYRQKDLIKPIQKRINYMRRFE